jgi:hypothetical protein
MNNSQKNLNSLNVLVYPEFKLSKLLINDHHKIGIIGNINKGRILIERLINHYNYQLSAQSPE